MDKNEKAIEDALMDKSPPAMPPHPFETVRNSMARLYKERMDKQRNKITAIINNARELLDALNSQEDRIIQQLDDDAAMAIGVEDNLNLMENALKDLSKHLNERVKVLGKTNNTSKNGSAQH